MRFFRIILLGAIVLVSASAASSSPLEEGFQTPPPETRLSCYWWWLNGNVTKQAITRDLEEMKAKGFGAAMIIDGGGADQGGNAQVPAGPMFGSPAWRELYKHALSEANRLGLEISLNILSGWNVGGPMVKPEQALKVATWSAVAVMGPAHFDRALETPKNKIGYYRDVAVLAYPLRHGAHPARPPIALLDAKTASREFGWSMPDTRPLLSEVPATPGEEDTLSSRVMDISGKMDAGGKLTWNVPPGEWEILRFGYAASGAKVSTGSETWSGLAIDYLDRGALETYWAEVVAPLIEDARPYIGKSLKYLVSDSWESGGANWTRQFREEFRKRRGYDLLPYLPVLTGRIVDGREIDTRFLNDFRRTVGDLIADDHYAAFTELAAREGLGTHPESGGPHGAPIDALRNLGLASFPQTEFWAKAETHRVKDEDRFFVKEASSAAHIYGKRLVAAEGFTSVGPQWEETIRDNLKPTFDRAICAGLNRMVWHQFTCSPAAMGKPGQEYFAGTHIDPNVTWWSEAGPFLRYINRLDFLMQQGLFVADALYYYGDQVPDFVRLKSSDPARVLPGYDYDGCDLYTLLHRVSVKDGRLVLPDGMSYRVLALQDVDVIAPEALRRIRELVAEGATVVGQRPLRSMTLSGGSQSEAEVTRIGAELWGSSPAGHSGERAFGKGRVIWGDTAREALRRHGVPPDFAFTSVRADADIDFVHRHAGDADIYFVSNQSARSHLLEATFRVSGKAPELWSPVTGEIRGELLYSATSDGRTSLPLLLDPYGSVVVVFREPAGDHFVSLAKDGQPLTPVAARRIPPGWAEVYQSPDGRKIFNGFAPGRYQLRSSTGRTVNVSVTPHPAPFLVTGQWTVSFAPGWGAPAATTFDALSSWTESADPSIRYFSGTAAYEKDVDLPAAMLRPGNAIELDLGDVRELAEVIVNGRNLGVLWSAPQVVDITAAVRPGRNHLEIRVTNFWPNRLIGDQFLPQAERRTHTNIRKFTKDSPLRPSGLLGPVLLRSSSRIPIEVAQ